MYWEDLEFRIGIDPKFKEKWNNMSEIERLYNIRNSLYREIELDRHKRTREPDPFDDNNGFVDIDDLDLDDKGRVK